MSESTRKVVERYYPKYMEPDEPVYAVEYWDDEWADWIELSWWKPLALTKPAFQL